MFLSRAYIGAGVDRLDLAFGSPGPPGVSSSLKHLLHGPGWEGPNVVVPAKLSPLGESSREDERETERERERERGIWRNPWHLWETSGCTIPPGNSEAKPPVHSWKKQFRQIASQLMRKTQTQSKILVFLII